MTHEPLHSEALPVSPRQPWVEPEVEQLDLSETAMQTGTGHDGNTVYSDCTKS